MKGLFLLSSLDNNISGNCIAKNLKYTYDTFYTLLLHVTESRTVLSWFFSPTVPRMNWSKTHKPCKSLLKFQKDLDNKYSDKNSLSTKSLLQQTSTSKRNISKYLHQKKLTRTNETQTKQQKTPSPRHFLSQRRRETLWYDRAWCAPRHCIDTAPDPSLLFCLCSSPKLP